MADTKITELTAASAASTDDLIPIVDSPGGSPANKKITFDNFQKSITTLEIPSGNYIYFGDPSSDGTWRIGVSGGDLVFQLRVSSSWVEKGAMIA